MNLESLNAGLLAVLFLSTSLGCSMPAGFAAPAGEGVAEIGAAATADQRITSRVKSALIADPGVSGSAIDVETESGSVILAGVVRSSAERARAIEVARSVEGVSEIQADLEVERDG